MPASRGARPSCRPRSTPEEIWDEVIAINLTGVFLCMKYEIRQMLAQGGGAIVNMASVAGLIGTRIGIGYGASKHGVIGATRAAALEYATSNIRVNAVCPGVVRTELTERAFFHDVDLGAAMTRRHPMGRLGTARRWRKPCSGSVLTPRRSRRGTRCRSMAG